MKEHQKRFYTRKVIESRTFFCNFLKMIVMMGLEFERGYNTKKTYAKIQSS